MPTAGREQPVLVTSSGRLPDPADARGQHTQVSSPQKSITCCQLCSGKPGAGSALIAKLAPDGEINVEAVSPRKLISKGAWGTEGFTPSCRFASKTSGYCVPLCVPGDWHRAWHRVDTR